MAESLIAEPVALEPPSPPLSASPCDELQLALAAYADDPGAVAARKRVTACATSLAQEIWRLSKRQQADPLVRRALQAVAQLSASGVNDHAVTHAPRAAGGRAQWQEIIAQMLTGAAWQWDVVPMMEEVPPWLWGDYTAWVFAPPLGFTAAGDADRYAGFLLPRLEELARLVERNIGSGAVRAAGDAFLRTASAIPLYFSERCLRRHAELRGRILKKLLVREAMPFETFAFPREGRRLKIGFLNRHFGPQTETYTTLPTFEHLDRDRFEVILFALQAPDTALAEYCRSRVSEFRLLPPDFEGQLAALRDASLDVLVFGTNVTAVAHEVTRLALHRIAPLQVVNNSSCVTTGLPTIDLYVSGDETESGAAVGQFTERLGLLRGPAHAFNYSADRQAPTAEFTRAALGIPATAPLFATAANYYKIIPEMQQTWARLLAAVPHSRLIVHPFNPNWSSSYPIKRFCAQFDHTLQQYGVSTDRLLISTERFASRTDVGALLKLADVYLDTFPFGGVNSLIDPLEAAVPVVAWEGDSFRSRMGAALLRALRLPQLIARTEQDYLRIATSLASDADLRTQTKAAIAAAMEEGPLFLDPLAASDAFGDLIETAFDELVNRGRDAFRRTETPLQVEGATNLEETLQAGEMSLAVGAAASAVEQARAVLRRQPNHAAARALLGRGLLALGASARAVDYLVAALPHCPDDPALWLDAAKALRGSRQISEAVQALEASLRLDRTNLDGWVMLTELAHELGAPDMARDALSVARELGREDPRVQSLAALVA